MSIFDTFKNISQWSLWGISPPLFSLTTGQFFPDNDIIPTPSIYPTDKGGETFKGLDIGIIGILLLVGIGYYFLKR